MFRIIGHPVRASLLKSKYSGDVNMAKKLAQKNCNLNIPQIIIILLSSQTDVVKSQLCICA